MKKFITRIIVFFIVFGLIFLVGISLPVTPISKSNMLSYKIQKDSLLRSVRQPRIIFIGGSNLVFGLNSNLLKDSLKINPINAGMAISIGLVYMMDDMVQFVQENDIVVIAPEYQHFYGKYAYGGNDLFRLLMDFQPEGFTRLKLKQLPNFSKSMPIYFLSKFKINNYFFDKENDLYGRHIFNEFGDSDFHWGKEGKEFPLVYPISSSFNHDLIVEMKKFKNIIENKGATLMVTYPAFQQKSYIIIKDQIDEIQRELEKSGIQIVGEPLRYCFPDSQMFESTYHLTKEGVDIRTLRFIEDFKNIQ